MVDGGRSAWKDYGCFSIAVIAAVTSIIILKLLWDFVMSLPFHDGG